jgi:hypothetical protein
MRKAAQVVVSAIFIGSSVFWGPESPRPETLAVTVAHFILCHGDGIIDCHDDVTLVAAARRPCMGHWLFGAMRRRTL